MEEVIRQIGQQRKNCEVLVQQVSSRYAEEAFETRIRHQRDQIERNQSILHKLFISRPGGFSFAGEDLHIPLSD